MSALRALALSALLLVATAIAAHADPWQYLCLAERSAMLHYDRQARAWAPQVAFVSGDRFVLRPLNDDERKAWHSDAGWGFFRLGEASPLALCTLDLNNCAGGAVEFDDNSSGARVTDVLMWHWYKDNPNDPDGLVIQAGQCSAF
jgi:hypothetical protein